MAEDKRRFLLNNQILYYKANAMIYIRNYKRSKMLKKLKIGNVELQNNIILAPMAGLTDLPFRLVCEKYNPGLVVL